MRTIIRGGDGITAKKAFANNTARTQCLKITEKVSFDIASEATNVYTLSGQTVLPNTSILIGQKLVENAKIEKF